MHTIQARLTNSDIDDASSIPGHQVDDFDEGLAETWARVFWQTLRIDGGDK